MPRKGSRNRPGAWSEMPACPKCGDERQVERVNHEWVCNCCDHTWPVVTYRDKSLLKSLHISPDGLET